MRFFLSRWLILTIGFFFHPSRVESDINHAVSKYIFLDNWVLADYTKPNLQPNLSKYLEKNQFTVIIDSLSLTELYNPGWRNAPEGDRTARVTDFLSRHPVAIVDPVKLFRAEIENYPNLVHTLPIELDMEILSAEHRKQTLKLLLQGDTLFINQGKDIKIWSQNYEKLKSTWLSDIDNIIEKASQAGILIRDEAGRFTQLETDKEKFLLTLDRRYFAFFDTSEMKELGTKIVELFLSETSKLPAIRFTSLCFWYAYIQIDKTHLTSRAPSDVGDFYQMSMIPYCTVFTTDNKMQWICSRILDENSQYSCTILNRGDLDKEIGIP